jgi:hypothetical protein
MRGGGSTLEPPANRACQTAQRNDTQSIATTFVPATRS